MNNSTQLEPVSGVRLWMERDASIHLKAVEPNGDPVELAGHEVEAVIDALQALLRRLRDPDAG